MGKRTEAWTNGKKEHSPKPARKTRTKVTQQPSTNKSKTAARQPSDLRLDKNHHETPPALPRATPKTTTKNQQQHHQETTPKTTMNHRITTMNHTQNHHENLTPAHHQSKTPQPTTMCDTNVVCHSRRRIGTVEDRARITTHHRQHHHQDLLRQKNWWCGGRSSSTHHPSCGRKNRSAKRPKTEPQRRR